MTARLTRRLFFIGAACAGFAAATAALAQPRQHLAPSPPPPTWRPPVLQVSGAEQPIRLQALRVDVEVSAGVAETRVQMEFFNPNGRILEGKLQFPLASGQIVSGFALDIDGELRDAVPVEKARAQQVFEDIVRRRVDPGLLQTTLGNNYELRIYPLAPGKTRTVVLRLVEPATTRLSLPLAYAKSVDRFEVSLRYASATARPQIVSTNPLGLVFERDSHGGFVARRSLDGAMLPNDPLIVQAAAAGAVEITTEQRGGDTFFTLNLAVSPQSAPRPMPRQVQIVWDASGSGAGRQLDRELALLDAYFKRAGTIAVTLTRFADVAQAGERFMVKNGDWTRPAPCVASDGLRRCEPARRRFARRHVTGSDLVYRRPCQLRRALAAHVPCAGLHGAQLDQRRPSRAASCRRSEWRPQHRSDGTDAGAGGRCVALARYATRRGLGAGCEGSRRRVAPCERRSTGSRRDAHSDQR